MQFQYEAAFDRNIGWVSEAEQQTLRFKRVAIAGMGGVGGVHLLTLTRLGIGQFHIADLDTFDLANINRQVGAMMSTLGRPKVDVLAGMAADINPEVRIRRFERGVTDDNVDAFLEGVDLFVDGFDFFALGIRARVFAACYARDIPAITAAPIGMGTGFLVFRPGGMSFERYFRLHGHPDQEQALRFLMGVAPKGLHRPYLVDETRIDPARQRGPSTSAACELCAGVVATEAVKLLLRRGRVRCAPLHTHFDAYRGRLSVSWLPFGAAGPIQTFKRAVARRIYTAMVARLRAADPPTRASVVENVLTLARWAPSGDNEQPWNFAQTDKSTIRVAFRFDPSNAYEFRAGQPVLLAGGMLLESIRLAATAFGRRADWRLESDALPGAAVVTLTEDADAVPDPLCAALSARSVDRNAYRMRRLTSSEKTRLGAALGPGLELRWHESVSARLALSRLGAMATDIRLRMPETFAIHNRVVDWRAGSSADGIPAKALGLTGPTRALLRWGSRSWARMNLLNRLGGTMTGGLQMDILPGLRSAALFTVARRGAAAMGVGETLEVGGALGRFWLEAERLGLSMQPALATLAFADYGARGADFTADASLPPKARRLAASLAAVSGSAVEDLVFLGRIGETRRRSTVRSMRHPLGTLLKRAGPATPV